MSSVALTVFIVCLAIVLYIILGYPLLLAWLARKHQKPIRKASIFPTVSAIVAVRDGARFLAQKLENLLALDYPQEKLEILVVSDGSVDETAAIARQYASRGVRLVEVPRSGKSAALNAGIQHATGELLFFTDVRQSFKPDCLRQLVACFADPTVGVASGELIIQRGETQEEADISLYRRYENWIRSRLSSLDSIFGATGCVYVMRRELAVNLPKQILLDDMYQPLAAFFKGYRLVFDSEALAYDYPTGLETEFWRKVRTLAGNYQILGAYPQLLSWRNRLWLHFLSYKFARLFLPFLLLAILISSLLLPPGWREAALAVQAVFYGCALLDVVVPQNWLLKRLTSPPRTFTVLMFAALGAIVILFISPQRLWKETRVSVPR